MTQILGVFQLIIIKKKIKKNIKIDKLTKINNMYPMMFYGPVLKVIFYWFFL